MAIKIPKRRVTFDIDGKLHEATALSLAYLTEATVNPEFDNIDNAIEDSMPGLTEEDLKHFDLTTKERLYREIVKFTFTPTVSDEQREEIRDAFKLSDNEMQSLSEDAILNLLSILESRNSAPQKKKSSSRQ